jgi:hypothetical protein
MDAVLDREAAGEDVGVRRKRERIVSVRGRELDTCCRKTIHHRCSTGSATRVAGSIGPERINRDQ